MARSYYPPDVEVLQQINQVSTPIDMTLLQAVIVGPSYKKFKDFDDADSTKLRLGSYSRNTRFSVPMPTLINGAKVDEESLVLSIDNYAGDNVIEKAVIYVDSETGSVTETGTLEGVPYAVFVDNNVDFLEKGVQAGPDASDHDGSFICFKADGDLDEYFEVQEIRDAHTLVIDDPDKLLSVKSNIAYIAGSFGWLINHDNNNIVITKRLSHSGTVYLRGRALRTDYCENLIQAVDVEELENIFGAGEVNIDNPLAYGMAKVLPYLSTDSVMGLMVDTTDEVLGYQKAFEELESKDVYCIVPLTNNPIVHNMLKEHVNKMSDVLEKRERIGLVNGGRIIKQVKSGLLGRKTTANDLDKYDFAEGVVAASGSTFNEDVICTSHVFNRESGNVSESQVFDCNGATRALIYVDSDEGSYTLTYNRVGSSTQNSITVNAAGYAIIEEGEAIDKVTFVANQAAEGKHAYVYAFKTIDAPAKNSIRYAYAQIADGSINVAGSTLEPAGKRCLKIRYFTSATNRTGAEALDAGTLPAGLHIKVTVNGELTDITSAGIHNFDRDISSIAFENDANASAIGTYAVELLMAENGGTYKVNTFKDELASFMSDNISNGEDKLVIIDKNTKDESTDSGYAEQSYVIENVVDEDELVISGSFNATPDSKLYYRIETPVISNKRDLADAYASVSEAFSSRRIVNTFAPAMAIIDEEGNEVIVPGYYANCDIAGMIQSYPSQKGLTNSALTGFSRVLYTNNYFSPTQLNKIAGSGALILSQANLNAPILIRHQLTTDMTGVKTCELSVTKNLDWMAKMARVNFSRYFGKYNIDEDLYKMLNEQAEKIVLKWKEDKVVLSGTTFKGFKQDPDRIDYVYACFDIVVPIPLNGIRLIFAI